MKITNKHGVPQTLVNLMERDTYTRGAAKISVTQLIDAPRVKLLKEANEDRLVVDVSETLWALIGKALHHVAEAGADEEHIAEERLFTEVHGWTLSGGIDLQRYTDSVVGIRDYKFTSVWAALQEKPEWENQLNVYSYLARVAKGWETKDLEICALLRDWNRHDAKKDRAYPQAPIARIRVRLWSPEEQEAYVSDRILLHQDAWRAFEWGEEVPLCTPKERWARPDTWAVQRKGGKRASRICNSEQDADTWRAEQKKPDDFEIEYRPGDQIRCGGYCAAAPFCDYAAALNDNSL